MGIEHGKVSSYRAHGCRCVLCTKANTDRHREYLKENPDQLERKRAFNREYMKKYNARKRMKAISPDGTGI